MGSPGRRRLRKGGGGGGGASSGGSEGANDDDEAEKPSGLFADSTGATELMRGHLFYLTAVAGIIDHQPHGIGGNHTQ